ncbi:unnamed protein product [Ceutorhynchus assimilis]|uniref:Virilizer N-terminal domain-containing protein n=1 Tax=Ceutorhynchus assimilis TaxID=467358 RepID=A0A9N9MIU2_9CUCU|nr:unnamed protein product [Ceutorhynchus assimilis]
MSDNVLEELLFFDTFAHDNTEELNLDLVQFPKPVYVTEVRIIPLGARIQADIPGGVRLGATNPSQFHIELFVNDLGKPGASTFETLGSFEYDQNGKINLQWATDDSIRKIPTDGLVLKGLYTTITLAVYGILTNNLAEQLVQPIVNPALPITQANTIADAQQIIAVSTVDPEWSQDNGSQQPIEYPAPSINFQSYGPEAFQQEFPEYFSEPPKDPRSYHHTPEHDWDKNNSRSEREKSSREVFTRTRRYFKYPMFRRSRIERDHSERRDRRYSRSESTDRDRQVKDYHDSSRDRDHERENYRADWSESDRPHDRERGRERRHDDNYRRSDRFREDREDRKRPRTPQSPKRPHSPEQIKERNASPTLPAAASPELAPKDEKTEEDVPKTESPVAVDESTTPQMDVEEFEPILSDEDILDDNEHYQEEYDYTAYTNNDDIIRQFIPGVTELQKYPCNKKYCIKDNTIEVDESLKTIIGITDDYLKSSITKYVLDGFSQLNTEIKEEFVHLAEKLIGIIGDSDTFKDIKNLHNAMRSLTSSKMTTENKELANQIEFIIETITDWLKIALDYDMANSQDQPAYKIRHIKCGVRLAEYLSYSNEYLQCLWQKSYKLHQVLVGLYQCEFMALSIKLMLLKALDTYLLHKFSIERFLGNSLAQNGLSDNNLPITDRNGYKIIVEAIKKNPLVREKFALSSILKKLNLYEILYKMHSSLIKLRNPAHDISAQEINLITKSLNQILNYCNGGPFGLSQPKRFLPVAAQFEIMRSDTRNILVDYFKMFNLLQCFVLLLTSPDTLNLPLIKTPIFEIVANLLESKEGLQYLSENSETINVLLKCLLRTDEEMQYSLNDSIEVHSHNLGLKIAYKLQGLYHIECLLLDIGLKHNYDFDNFDIIDQLHGMFCLTFSSVGKFAIGELLGMGDNIQCLLQFLEQVNFKSEMSLMKFKQSASAGYILDLLYYPIVTVANVQFLEKYASKLRDCIGLLYETSTASKINEIKTYLSPFDNITSLNYDNMSQFLDIIDRHTPTVISHPGSLITCLRIIQHLGISTYDNKIPIISENPLYNYMELKYKHVILQIYSLDGINILIKLLQKLCNHFEQPGLHSSIFVSNQGLILVNIIYPVLLLFNKIMAYVVQCRNTKFKDLTSVPVLLKTYNLLNSFPLNSLLSRKCKIAIIDCLLVYTQPMSDEISEKDSLNKTLWSQMLGEVIKFVTTAPYTFVSGLLVLSELLPLPLPIHTGDDLSKDEISWTINLRKLWSAHLHPHSAILQDTVHKICISTQPQLLNLLRRICVQISDLAANSALMIARGFLDLAFKALTTNLPCTSHVARLLNFLACLVTHNTIKCAVLHLIHCDDNYSKLIPAFERILKLSDGSTSHIQAQECVLSIIQSFCDVEVSLLQNSETLKVTSEVYLANALPIKEHLLSFIGVILDHLATENSFVTYLPIVRTLLLLTEHDYGFFHLRENLLKRENLFGVMLNKFVKSFSKTSPECLSTLNILVEFLRICLTTEESDGVLLYTPRTIMLSVEEMKNLIGWSQVGEGEKHPFIILEEILKKEIEDDNSLETILEGLTLFLKQLDQPTTTASTAEEVLLPTPQPLLAQYSGRIISSSSDACDERLTDRYWLILPSEEGEGELETVPCDLFEICRQLPPEFNLIKEVEKLCRISRTDPPHVDKAIKHCDEQRIKTRKPFITPMRPRGFPRTTPQRPDLFRSRPPNTSRPPSLHVDDFVALETCGAQPTGYNKLSRDILATNRMARGARGRAFVTSERSMQYNRQMPWWGASMGRGPYF